MMPIPNQVQIRRDRPLCHRMMAATCVLTLCFSVVVWRLYDLHLKRGPELAEKAAQKFREDRPLSAQRGSIKDQGGRYLAYDEEVYELQTNRVHLYEMTTVRGCLAKVRGVRVPDLTRMMTDADILREYHDHTARSLTVKLGKPLAETLAIIQSKEQIVVIADNMSEEQAAEWRTHLRMMLIKGISVKPAVRRHYPTENRLALIVGGMEDGKGGVSGIEKTYQNTLHGTPGKVVVEHDKNGREMPLYRGEVREPVNGRDVHLTIDMPLQDAVDHIIMQADKQWQPRKIMAVVTDVATGSVLAMSFLPDHNRKVDPKKLDSTNWKNLAICEPYEPGSTFKIVAFTAGIDLKKITADERINCEGGYFFDPVLKAEVKDMNRLGIVPVHIAFAKSSNIGTYKIFKQIGRESFVEYVRRFGFGKKTGVALTGERSGQFNEGVWSNTTPSSFPIGYEVDVTPLQMAMAYGAIANGGILMKPRLVDRIVSDGGRKVEIVPPEVVCQVCTGKTAATMRDLTREVVTGGTGTHAALGNIEVAGKTGTARRHDSDYIWQDEKGKWHKGGYPPNQWIVSFAGFAPANNPKIACVVVLSDPKAKDPKDIGGGLVAAPIFAEIVAETLKQLSVRPQRPLALQGGAE